MKIAKTKINTRKGMYWNTAFISIAVENTKPAEAKMRDAIRLIPIFSKTCFSEQQKIESHSSPPAGVHRHKPILWEFLCPVFHLCLPTSDLPPHSLCVTHVYTVHVCVNLSSPRHRQMCICFILAWATASFKRKQNTICRPAFSFFNYQKSSMLEGRDPYLFFVSVSAEGFILWGLT